ncbi:hypothetical protein HDV06_004074 [Boothiomyces sp. JEL0866]|nr:hypothetical protein HDV06_004074 [Boothiomyces sp. JEL0866]
MHLTTEQINQFDRDGFLVIPNFFDPKELRDEAANLLNAMDLKEHPLVKFTTGDKEHVGNEYFLESGDKIRYFLETDAVDESNNLKYGKERAINKIGHALHELDPVFKKFTLNKNLAEIAESLEFKDPRVLQSMLIFKQPSIGGIVPAHVDSTFLYTDPPSCKGLWFALEDCTLENGCMWFAPGSHKKYPLQKRFVRDGNSATKTVYLADKTNEPADDEYVAAPVTAGSLVLIHGLVHHKSGANKSDKSRWIYTFHMIEGQYPYPSDNWLLPTPSMPFSKLF